MLSFSTITTRILLPTKWRKMFQNINPEINRRSESSPKALSSLLHRLHRAHHQGSPPSSKLIATNDTPTMVLPPTVSPVTGESVPSYYIHSSSPHFQDNSGRTLLLRGINLSSSAKTPIGQPGAQLEGFWETGKSGEMSFVGRVLDLEDGKVDEHLERLRSWGFNTFRYVVTWESIEHKGP